MIAPPNAVRFCDDAVPLTETRQSWKEVSLMYFEGCAPELGATVVLRGGDEAELGVIKRLLASAASVAADLRAEAATLHLQSGYYFPSRLYRRPRLRGSKFLC